VVVVPTEAEDACILGFDIAGGTAIQPMTVAADLELNASLIAWLPGGETDLAEASFGPYLYTEVTAALTALQAHVREVFGDMNDDALLTQADVIEIHKMFGVEIDGRGIGSHIPLLRDPEDEAGDQRCADAGPEIPARQPDESAQHDRDGGDEQEQLGPRRDPRIPRCRRIDDPPVLHEMSVDVEGGGHAHPMPEFFDQQHRVVAGASSGDDLIELLVERGTQSDPGVNVCEAHARQADVQQVWVTHMRFEVLTQLPGSSPVTKSVNVIKGFALLVIQEQQRI